MGVTNLKDRTTVQDRKIDKIERYPTYIRNKNYDDIALLKLDRPVQINGYVRPACLPIIDTTTAGENAIASGWGSLECEFFFQVASDLK